MKGPFGPVYDVLDDGEVERARTWGEGLAAKVAARGSAVATG